MTMISDGERKSVHELENNLNNSMLTVVREARLGVNERLPHLGEARYLQECMDKLQPGMASIPYPLSDVTFDFVTRKGEPLSEVLLYVPIEGDTRIFQYLRSQYIRISGVLGGNSKHRLYINYRASQFADSVQLHQLFLSDIDLLRQFLQRVNVVHEKYREELRAQVKAIMLEVRPQVETVLELAQGLETLGYRRFSDEAEGQKSYHVFDMAQRPSG